MVWVVSVFFMVIDVIIVVINVVVVNFIRYRTYCLRRIGDHLFCRLAWFLFSCLNLDKVYKLLKKEIYHIICI